MEQFLHLESLKSQQDVEDRVDSALLIFMNQKQIKKEQGNNFLNAILNNLEDPKSPSISKFYSVMMLKELTERRETKILSLMTGHQLFKKLQEYAHEIDPKKPMSQKGMSLFSKDKDKTIGNNFMRIILQCLIQWGTIFQKNQNQQPTKFKKVLISLNTNKVVLPTEYTYFKRRQKAEKPTDVQKEKQKQTNIPKTQKPSNFAASQIRFTFNKIQQIVGNLEEIDDPDEISERILKDHEIFNNILEQYSSAQNLQGMNEEMLNKYIAIVDFLNEEKKNYEKLIPKNDFVSYKTNLSINFQNKLSIFYEDQPKQELKRQEKKKTSLNQNLKQTKDKLKSNEEIPKVEMNEVPIKITKVSERQNSHLRKNITEDILTSLIQTKEQRDKSKSGFKYFIQSLEKEKKNIQVNPPRSRVSPTSKVNNKIPAKSLVKSTVGKVNPIFVHPPNLYPPYQNYEGSLISQNRQFRKILYDLKNQQGERRLKLSNLRLKGLLFENQHIQIGYKSEPVYERVDQYESLLSLDLFIGNKGEKQIKQFHIEFLGDENTLLYSNPKQFHRDIPPGEQLRHELMIIPKKTVFNFMNMRVSYNHNAATIYSTVALPFSLLKFAKYQKKSIQDCEHLWKRSIKIKSQPFSLSSHFPPKSLIKQIPDLIQLTEYNDFLKEGSNTDYVLSCSIIVMDNYEAVLRINIRPNLKVIIQIGIIQQDDEAAQSLQSYLETLQFVLSST